VSELISPKHWNDSTLANTNQASYKDNFSPNHEPALKPYEGPGTRILEENIAFSYPTGQMNMPLFPGSEGVLKSLIKLPRLNHRNVPSDNSPGLASPGSYNISPNLKLYRDASNSPVKVERVRKL